MFELRHVLQTNLFAWRQYSTLLQPLQVVKVKLRAPVVIAGKQNCNGNALVSANISQGRNLQKDYSGLRRENS